MEASDHWGFNIVGFGRLFCVLSFLVSFSRGNVIITPGEGLNIYIVEANHALNSFKLDASRKYKIKRDRDNHWDF